MSTLAQMVIYDVYASLPAAGIPGRTFYVSGAGTNAGKGYRDNGSSWDQIVSAASGSSPLTTKGDVYGYSSVDARIPVGSDGDVLTADSTQALGVKWAAGGGGGGGTLGYSTTTPPSTSWTQVNWGTSSVFTGLNGSIVVQFQNIGSNSFIGYVQPSPGVLYTATIGLKQFGKAGSLALYDSISGNAMNFFCASGGNVYGFNYSGFGYNSRQISDGSIAGAGALEVIWLRIVEDAIHRTFYLSMDGQVWVQWAQVAAGNFLIPDHIGIGCDATGCSPLGAMLFSFSLTSP